MFDAPDGEVELVLEGPGGVGELALDVPCGIGEAVPGVITKHV